MSDSLTLSPDALSVLRTVRKRAMDGYTVMSRIGVAQESLLKAVTELHNQSLISVKGELSPRSIGEAYLFLSSEAKRRAAMYFYLKV